ncbi:MAG: glycosyltransferase family 39 protein [Acidobacteriota bacterium]|nr:glycosyltransferase family 39 protein [Acidobacteriota bacterium]
MPFQQRTPSAADPTADLAPDLAADREAPVLQAPAQPLRRHPGRVLPWPADALPEPDRRGAGALAVRRLMALLVRVFPWLWLAAALGILGYGIFQQPLIDPDEGRNAEVAREMLADGHYLLPELNGLPFLDKPFFVFALAAEAMRWLGPTPGAARLPSLVFGLATVLLTAWFARRLWGPREAWIAGLAAASTPLTLVYARTVIFDSVLTFFIVLAIVSFHQLLEQGAGSPQRRYWLAMAWGAMALGTMTKGPVAVVVPLLIAIPYGALRRDARAMWRPVGWGVFLAAVLPWLLFMERAVPGFLHYALITETWLRMTTPELQRTGPIWYFAGVGLVGAMPWSWVALGGVGRRWGRDWSSSWTLVALWVLLPLLFFTLSQSKRPQYILPVVPAIALMVAGLWKQRDGRRTLPGARLAALAWAVTGSGLGAVALGWVDVGAAAELQPLIPLTAAGLAVAAWSGALVTWWGASSQRWAAVGLSLPLMMLPLISQPLLMAVARDRSAGELALAIEAAAGPQAEVIGVEALPQSLPFYLGRPVAVASSDGHPIKSTYLERSFEYWVSRETPTVRPLSWWRQTLSTCTGSQVFVVKSGAEGFRRQLEEASMPLILDDGRFAAYGPCRAASSG